MLKIYFDYQGGRCSDNEPASPELPGPTAAAPSPPASPPAEQTPAVATPMPVDTATLALTLEIDKLKQQIEALRQHREGHAPDNIGPTESPAVSWLDEKSVALKIKELQEFLRATPTPAPG